MKNMLRENLFLLRHRASTYILSAILLLFALLSGYVESLSTATDFSDSGCGFTRLFSTCGSLSMLLCAIGNVLLLGEDFKNGFIKNIAGIVRSRMHYLVPKAITLVILDLTILFGAAVGSMLGSILFLNGIQSFDAAQFFGYLGALTLLLAGFAMLLMFFVFLTRSSAASMAIAVFLGSGMFYSIFYSLLEIILDKLDITFNFAYVSVTMQIGFLSPSATGKELLTACAIAAGYILVFGFLSKLVLSKKDIA